MGNRCFVCNVEKSRFDHDGHKKGISNGFRLHITTQHNMWDYLFFMVYLRHKPATEYTGAETFLARCIEEESPEWIPINRSIVLEDDTTPEDTAQQQYEGLQAALAQQSNAVATLAHAMQSSQKQTQRELRAMRVEVEARMEKIQRFLRPTCHSRPAGGATEAPQTSAVAGDETDATSVATSDDDSV